MTIQESLIKLAKLVPTWITPKYGASASHVIEYYVAGGLRQADPDGLLGAAIRQAEAEGLSWEITGWAGDDGYDCSLWHPDQEYPDLPNIQDADSPAGAILGALVAYYEAKR